MTWTTQILNNNFFYFTIFCKELNILESHRDVLIEVAIYGLRVGLLNWRYFKS